MIIPTASAGASARVAAVPQVSDFGLNDDKTILRRVEGIVNPLVAAKLTVKTNLSDADGGSVILKNITTTLSSSGQITDDGTGDGVGSVQFELAPAETALLTSAKYYEISVTDSGGNLYKTEHGIMSAAAPTANPNARKRVGNWQLSSTSLEPPSGGSRLLFSELIDDLDQGEVYSFTRKIQGTLPVGWTIVNLVFTVRRAATDPDGAAIVQKTVTPGVLATDGTYPVAVNLTAANTALLIGAMVWDAKLVLTNGTINKKYTVAVGTVNAQGPLPAVGTILPPVFSMAIATPPTVGFTPVQLVLTMADSSTVAINPATRVVTWGSSNKAVATVSQTGLVSAVAVGTCDITATCEGSEVRATVTVQAMVFSVAVTPNPIGTLIIGATQALTTVVRDAASNILTGRTLVYTSSDPTIASVDSSGVVHAVAPGAVTITVTCEGVSTTTAVTVPVPVAQVLVTPSPLTVVATLTQQLTVVTKDALGNVLTGRTITYHSDNTGVATVSGTGLVTGVANGTANITATSEGITSSNDVTTVTTDDVLTLVAALGGNAAVPAIYDVRRGITIATGVSQWDDARGSTGFGPSLVQATTTKQPAFTSGVDSAKLITLNGSTHLMGTAAFAGFDGSTGITLVFIGQVSADGYYLAIENASDGLDGIVARNVGSAYRTDMFLRSTFPSVLSGVSRDATRRIVFAASSGTVMFAEVPAHAAGSGAAGAIASGNKTLTLGASPIVLPPVVPMTVRAVLVLAGAYTTAQRNTIDTWAVANHAAVLAS